MRGAVHPLPQYAFMAWCSVKAQGQLYLYLYSVLCYYYIIIIIFILLLCYTAAAAAPPPPPPPLTARLLSRYSD
jgi:hypothetical protein